ncbi:MAG: hypothetical protein RR319_02295 [Bacteroides sp.]
MKSLFKVLILSTFALLLWGTTNFSSSTTVDEGTIVSQSSTERNKFDERNFHCFQDVELGGIISQSQQRVNAARIQRYVSIESSSFLKLFVRNIAYRDDALALHFGHIYASTSINFSGQSPIDYYVFTLRHILI